MRRIIPFLSVAAIVVLLIATGVLVQKLDRASSDFAQLKTEEQEARSRYTEAFDSMAEIQDSLAAITLGDSVVGLRAQGLRDEMRLTNPTRSDALERIALINASIQRAKERIATLEQSLRKSGTRIRGLERMIAGLKRTVEQREQQVAALSVQVDSLRTEVANGQETIATQQQTLEQKQDELATVYYTIGTKRDLTRSGVVTAQGGVLGLGKTLKLTGQFDGGSFTPLDTDEQTVLTAPARKAQVLSPQPVTSYELRLVGTQMELRILDPAEFRKVKHLVIMTS